MKRRIFTAGVFLLAISVGVIIAMSASPRREGLSPSLTRPVTDYTVTGPYTHKNLTVFLLHGANQ